MLATLTPWTRQGKDNENESGSHETVTALTSC
jgi:hypothetical protein